MQKATAVWLVENTSLTFEQIAEFCDLHVLEVKGIADGDVAHGIKGMDPISSGQLTRRGDREGPEEQQLSLTLAKSSADPRGEAKRVPSIPRLAPSRPAERHSVAPRFIPS